MVSYEEPPFLCVIFFNTMLRFVILNIVWDLKTYTKLTVIQSEAKNLGNTKWMSSDFSDRVFNNTSSLMLNDNKWNDNI